MISDTGSRNFTYDWEPEMKTAAIAGGCGT